MGSWAWRALAAVLAVALAALVAGSVVVARSTTPPDDDLTGAQHEVAAAARAEVLAFFRVDHRDMDPLADAVLAGATGDFAEQYAAQRDRLVRRAVRTQATSVGEVVSLGVSEVDGDSATVVVAANSTVTNTRSDKPEVRFYRIRLDLVREGGLWLTNDVEFVR